MCLLFLVFVFDYLTSTFHVNKISNNLKHERKKVSQNLRHCFIAIPVDGILEAPKFLFHVDKEFEKDKLVT